MTGDVQIHLHTCTLHTDLASSSLPNFCVCVCVCAFFFFEYKFDSFANENYVIKLRDFLDFFKMGSACIFQFITVEPFKQHLHQNINSTRCKKVLRTAI
jgi:hypothetical protein